MQSDGGHLVAAIARKHEATARVRQDIATMAGKENCLSQRKTSDGERISTVWLDGWGQTIQ